MIKFCFSGNASANDVRHGMGGTSPILSRRAIFCANLIDCLMPQADVSILRHGSAGTGVEGINTGAQLP